MKEERDIVLIVVPFTAGVLAVSYSLDWFYIFSVRAFAALGGSLVGIAVLAFALLRGANLTKPRPIRQRRAGAQDSGEAESVASPGEDPVQRMAGAREWSAWQRGIVLCTLSLLAGAAVSLLSGLSDWGSGIGAAAWSPGFRQGGAMAGGGAGLPVGATGRFIARCGVRFREMIDSLPYGQKLSNALVKALLAGDRTGLSWEVRRSFREAGASHLLALSGLHLSVIYLVLSKILSVTGNSPAAIRIRSILIILGSAFFTLMTGASPSLVRAFLFILLRECASILRRRVRTINIFCMSLMLQLALSPQDSTSVGFQLSYLAMLGIYVVYPPLERLWDLAGARRRAGIATKPDADETVTADTGRGRAFGAAMRKVWSLCALSISCQVFTAPAVLLYFGTFPRYFLITNLLCLPLSNVLITVSVFTAILGMAGICPGFLLHLTDFLVSALVWILDTIAGM